VSRDEFGRWLFLIGLVLILGSGSVLAVRYWYGSKPTYSLVVAVVGCLCLAIGLWIVRESEPQNNHRGFEVKLNLGDEPETKKKENDHG
jgi:glucose uptake protein GlcU